MDTTDFSDIQQMMASWLDHGGTRLIAKKLREAADKALLEYDAAVLANDHEKVQRIAITRWFILEELPRLVEVHINPPTVTHRRFKFWDWFKFRVA